MGAEGGLARGPRERFAALDFLRGVAALCVLINHLPWTPPSLNPFPRGHLAVDLFFLLSGFVISHAYEHRLGNALQFKAFYIARVIRLYPLYVAATLALTAQLIVISLAGKEHDPELAKIATSFATAIFLLPTPIAWSVDPTVIFPLIDTAWSLFWEEVVNVVYAAAFVRVRGAWITIPVAIAFVVLSIAGVHYGTLDLGWQPDKVWPGVFRAGFPFFFGVALYRLRQRFRAPRIPALPLPIALVLSFLPSFGGPAYELACVLLLYPTLIWFGAESRMGPRSRQLGLLLGYISYPVYLLQVPILLALALCTRWTGRLIPPASLAWWGTEFFLVIALSWLAAILFDTPVRGRLNQRFAREAPRMAAQTAP